jgi:hypothetical protein
LGRQRVVDVDTGHDRLIVRFVDVALGGDLEVRR